MSGNVTAEQRARFQSFMSSEADKAAAARAANANNDTGSVTLTNTKGWVTKKDGGRRRRRSSRRSKQHSCRGIAIHQVKSRI